MEKQRISEKVVLQGAKGKKNPGRQRKKRTGNTEKYAITRKILSWFAKRKLGLFESAKAKSKKLDV